MLRRTFAPYYVQVALLLNENHSKIYCFKWHISLLRLTIILVSMESELLILEPASFISSERTND